MNYKSDYPTEQKNTLDVPPTLTTVTPVNRYALPEGDEKNIKNGQATLVVPKNQVYIERAGAQRWLVVEGKTPADIWPLLTPFWADYGFTIKSGEPEAGLMETDWAERRAKLKRGGIGDLLDTVGLGGINTSGERDMFRVRLETSKKGTEIYFTHRGMTENFVEGKADSTTKWQTRPADPELEAAFLARFMTRFGQTKDEAVAELQAQAPKQLNAKIEGQTIILNDDFERAWRRVGLVLDRTGLTVMDRNRAEGLFYVQLSKSDLTPNQQKSGFGWFSSDKKPDNAPSPTQYRVSVKMEGEQTVIRFFDDQGKPIAPDVFDKIAPRIVTELQ
ncbi:MAG: outer membrane protein assembly factor BamC [Neisseriaceae bacterium]|nr:outer membrane protein assembly factor BamC [Neisseriaceae bacterium]